MPPLTCPWGDLILCLLGRSASGEGHQSTGAEAGGSAMLRCSSSASWVPTSAIPRTRKNQNSTTELMGMMMNLSSLQGKKKIKTTLKILRHCVALPSSILALAGSCSGQRAVGTGCRGFPPFQPLQGDFLLECGCTKSPHESRLALQSRSLGTGLPWLLPCPLPHDGVLLGTHVVRLVSVCFPQRRPSASGLH